MGLPKKQKLVNTKEILIPQIENYNDEKIDWVEKFKTSYDTKEEHGYVFFEMMLKHEDENNAHEHVETIHEHRNSGNICIFRKIEGRVEQRFFSYDELLQAIHYDAFYLEKDVYIGMNTYYIPKRQSAYIKHLRTLYVDLDIEKEGLVREEVDKHLEKMFANGEIPKPTLKLESGRGYHLVWCIEDAPYQALPTWQYAEDMLIVALKNLGVDPQVCDSSRILRMTGSVNSKNNALCEILENTKRMYLLRNLTDVLSRQHDVFKGKFTKSNKNKKVTQSNVRYRLTVYSLHFARREDMIKLCELRNWNLKGSRELILFLYRYWSCLFHKNLDEALSMTLELNKRFAQPLSSNEVEKATHSANRYFKAYTDATDISEGAKKIREIKETFGGKQYVGFSPRNTTLIKWLKITEQEQKHLKTIISKEEKYERNNKRRNKARKEARRNEKGLTPKQQEILELKERILKLKEEGLSIRKISEVIGKSKGSIENILKK